MDHLDPFHFLTMQVEEEHILCKAPTNEIHDRGVFTRKSWIQYKLYCINLYQNKHIQNGSKSHNDWH